MGSKAVPNISLIQEGIQPVQTSSRPLHQRTPVADCLLLAGWLVLGLRELPTAVNGYSRPHGASAFDSCGWQLCGCESQGQGRQRDLISPAVQSQGWMASWGLGKSGEPVEEGDLAQESSGCCVWMASAHYPHPTPKMG